MNCRVLFIKGKHQPWMDRLCGHGNSYYKPASVLLCSRCSFHHNVALCEPRNFMFSVNENVCTNYASCCTDISPHILLIFNKIVHEAYCDLLRLLTYYKSVSPIEKIVLLKYLGNKASVNFAHHQSYAHGAFLACVPRVPFWIQTLLTPLTWTFNRKIFKMYSELARGFKLLFIS